MANKVLPFPGHRRRRPTGWPLSSAILIAAPLATFVAVLCWDFGPPATAFPGKTDRESARFARCVGPIRETCVIDGDTFWYRGTKIRVADINAPETGEPRCPSEAELGARATARFTALLNAGPFSLQPGERETDRYGRRLFIVTRGGESLGARLEAEGLAERWRGHRRNWC